MIARLVATMTFTITPRKSQMACFRKWRVAAPVQTIITSLCAAVVVALVLPAVASARNLTIRPLAGVACRDFVLSCENGRDYPFCPRAISEFGDVVTGTLMTAPHPGVHVRLIPMGAGYRYAGRGIWFDGDQNAAVLNFGKHKSVACTVTGTAREFY